MDASHTADTPTDLDVFVRRAKAAAVSDAALVGMLRQSGWSERAVYQSLRAYYAEVIGVSPPVRSGGGVNARDAFFYLLYFFTLACWTLALGNVFWVAIDRAFPDALHTASNYDYSGSFMSAVSFSLATLFIAFPVFVVVHLLIGRELRRRPEAAESGVRSWLTYLALVATAATVIGDGIAVVDELLTGSVSTRSLLDAVLIAAIGGGVFVYFFTTLRMAGSPGVAIVRRAAPILAFAAVAGAIGLGFGFTGDPLHQRAIALDRQRVQDLTAIAEYLDSHPVAVPTSLPPNILGRPNVDPETNRPYEYARTGPQAYRLCATFAGASEAGDTVPAWAHPAGHACYAFSASNTIPNGPAVTR